MTGVGFWPMKMACEVAATPYEKYLKGEPCMVAGSQYRPSVR